MDIVWPLLRSRVSYRVPPRHEARRQRTNQGKGGARWHRGCCQTIHNGQKRTGGVAATCRVALNHWRAAPGRGTWSVGFGSAEALASTSRSVKLSRRSVLTGGSCRMYIVVQWLGAALPFAKCPPSARAWTSSPCWSCSVVACRL